MPREVPFTPLFLAVKLTDIGLTTMYFLVAGLVFAKLFDLVYGEFKEDDYKKMNKFVLFLDILFHLFLIGIAAYILRNVVGLIPFPLEGVAGFQHKRLKELSGGTVLAMVLLFFQRNLRDKITYFANSVFGIEAVEKNAEELEPPSAEGDEE
jgi:hypothetical protein